MVIALAVFLSKFLGPLWGGLFSTFPAVITSTLFLLSRAHNINFALSNARMIGYAFFAMVSFVVVLHYLLPLRGVAIGMFVSYLVSVVVAAAIYWLVKD